MKRNPIETVLGAVVLLVAAMFILFAYSTADLKVESGYKLNADFWLAENSFHVDAMFKYPEEYGKKMKIFFEKNLN